MAAMPIYGKKPSKLLLLKNQWADLADILPEAYEATLYIKWLKSFWSDHKLTLSGWGKFGKNNVKFQKHGLFELRS